MKQDERTAIIILNWNNYPDTKETLDSLLGSDLCAAQIFLVDNASTDGSFEKLKKEFALRSEITFTRNDKNYGFAEGNNIAMKRAAKDGFGRIMLLNNDVKVDKLFLRRLLEAESRIGSRSVS